MHNRRLKFYALYINAILTCRQLFCGYFCVYRRQKLELADCKFRSV